MEYWRSSSLGFVLAFLATTCQGASQHSECDIYHGITCYWNVAHSHGVYTLIPTPGFQQQYFKNSECPRLPKQDRLEPCTQYYSHCDEETKEKFEACETTYQSIKKLLGDNGKCQELSLLRECINHDKMTNCRVHFYLGPSWPSEQANLNASIKLRQCLGEALEPCSDERMVEPKKTAEALAQSVRALFQYLEIPILRDDVKPSNTTKTSGQPSTLPYAQKSSSQYESTPPGTTTEPTQKQRGDLYHQESFSNIPAADLELVTQSLNTVSVTRSHGISSSDVEGTTTVDVSFTTPASGYSKHGALADTTAGTSKQIECNVFRATSCYWTAAWIYGVSTLIPTSGHEEQYLSQSNCPKNATMEAKRIPLLWKHFIRPQQAPAEAECTWHYSICSKETKATFAKHEEAYESLRQVIADHAKCRELSQLQKCIKQDTMKNCTVHVSIVPLMDSAEQNLKASTKLSSCLEEALEPCSAGYMTEPKKLARFISTSVSVLLRNPEKPLQRDHVESHTTITTSLRSSEVPVTTAALHEFNQTPDKAITEGTWKQTDDLPHHETVSTSHSYSIESSTATPMKYTTKQTDFHSSKGERHNIDSMPTTPTYLRDPQGSTKSLVHSTVMPDQQTPPTEYETTTETSPTLSFSTEASGYFSLGLAAETSTKNHEHSGHHTYHKFSDGSQSTTGQPLESISTNKPNHQSDQATSHREPEWTSVPPLRKFKPREKPEDAPTETETEPTPSQQLGTRMPVHQPARSTPAAQAEETSAPPSRTYKPVPHPYDARTATDSEPTSAPPSGVSATSVPAISVLLSFVVLSLAQAFRACA